MAHLPVIDLNRDWRFLSADDIDPAYGVSALDESAWGVLPALADFPREAIGYDRPLNLQRRFDLEPIGEVCLRYVLEVANAPARTAISINGWRVATSSGDPLTVDVTDQVTLEDNLILLQVFSKRGALDGVRVFAVPCDSPSP
jgi:hypothetical protein